MSTNKNSTSASTGQSFSTLEIVLDALREHGCDPQEKAGKVGGHSPAHLDHNPSLSIKEADDGRVLVYCLSHQCRLFGTSPGRSS